MKAMIFDFRMVRALGLCAAMLAAAPTFAQPMPQPSVAVLDVQRILRESLAAKSVKPQMEKLRTGFQKEIRGKENALRKADRELAGQRAILAPEAYAKRRRDFEQRAKEAQRQVQTRKRLLDRALGKARRQVELNMIEVAKEIASERKINIVLLKTVVVMSMKSLDITPETLKRLNKRLPSVTVVVEKKK